MSMRPCSAPRDSRLASALAWDMGAWRTAPLGKEPTSWICPCCTMPWVKKGARKCMGCGKKTEPIDTANNLATLEMAGTHWQLTVDDQGNAVWTAAGPQVPKALIRTGPATSSSAPRWTSASWPPTRWHARTRTRPASRTSSPPRSGR